MGQFRKILDQDQVRFTLLLSSLFLAAYEVMCDSIVENIRNFYTFDYKGGRPVIEASYKTDVADLAKSTLNASCMWLIDAGAITQEEMAEIFRIHDHRNVVAHELPKLLVEDDFNIDIELFHRMRALVAKIELWWIRNVHIPTDPDFDGQTISDEDIRPGPVILLDYLIQIALAEYMMPPDRPK